MQVFIMNGHSSKTIFNTMNMNPKKTLRNLYKRHGKKALIAFGVYFVTKWTLTFIFGAQIIAFVKGLF